MTFAEAVDAVPVTFMVRAVVGSKDDETLVEGVASDAVTATTEADLAPSLGSVSDKVYTQDESVSVKLPRPGEATAIPTTCTR